MHLHEGVNCEENVDECLSNPCQNGGICRDRDNGYICTCPPGYLGTHCEIDVAVCETGTGARCHNGGECIEGPGLKFTCRCAPGWRGHICQDEINECESSPCQNGGVCVDRLAAYVCACPMGYTGINCEEEILICSASPCQNNALCLMEEGVPTCYCVPDFHGERCEYQYDECQLGPKCMNGGVCIDGVDTFTCSCPPLLTGLFCECLMLDGGLLDCNYTGPPPIPITTTRRPPTTTRISIPRYPTTRYPTTRYPTHWYTATKTSSVTTVTPFISQATTIRAQIETSTGTPESESTEDSGETVSSESESTENLTTEPRFEFDSTITTTMRGITVPVPVTTKSSVYHKTTIVPPFSSYDEYTTHKSRTPIEFTHWTTTRASTPYREGATETIDLSSRTTILPPSQTKPPYQTLPTETPFETSPTQSPHSFTIPTKSIFEPSPTIPSYQPSPTEPPFETMPTQSSSESSSAPLETTSSSSEEYIDYDAETTTTTTAKPRGLIGITTTIVPFFTEYPEIFVSTKYADTTKELIASSHFTTYKPPPPPPQYTTPSSYPYEPSEDSEERISTITTTAPPPPSPVIPTYRPIPTYPPPVPSPASPPPATTQPPPPTLPPTTTPPPPQHTVTIVPPLVTTRPPPPVTTTQTVIQVSSTWSSQPSFRPTPPPFSFIPEHTTKSLYTEDLVTYAQPAVTTEQPAIPQPTSPPPENFTGIPDCGRVGCFNGGTCVTTTEGSRCVCRFDRQGPLCETPIIIKNAAFSGDSYVSHRIHKDIPHHDTLESVLPMHIQLKVRTRATNGLIMLAAAQGSKGRHYMALFLQKGLLQFQFSCGLQTMLLSELETPVNTGNEIVIRAELDFSRNLTHCNASLLVNDTLAMSGDQPTWLKLLPSRMHTPDAIQNTWLHLGGAPQAPIGLIIELPPAQSGTGFTGCLHSLRINGEDRDIFEDALDGFSITECGSLACLSSPCRNGAACIKIEEPATEPGGTKQEKWKCKCPTGYMGPTCEISVCEDNPCQYGGTCVQFPGSGYLCLCPLGKHGHYCEHNLEVALPSFSGSVNGLSSFVAYTVPIPLEYSIELSFKILPQTMSQISLLAFLGQSGYHDEKSDHLAVSFIQGYIMLTWNLGGGPRRIFTQKPIDFRLDAPRVPYEIKVGRIGRQAWLSVDGKFNITGRSPGSVTRMDVMPILYLGGHEIANFNTLPHDLPLHSGFQGCIYDVQLKAGQVTVPLQETRGVRGRGVGQCGTRECHRHACQHDGACLQHGATFTCICQEGWYGPLCAQASNPCDSFNNKCAEGSTCVPLVNGYECDCPVGKTGKNCEEDIRSLSDVSLTGRRSYLAVRWPNFNTERSERVSTKRSQIVHYRNFTKKIMPKPISYTSQPGQHFVMKLLNEVEKQRGFTSPPLVNSPSLDDHHRVQFFFIEFQIRPLSERGLLLYFGSLNNNHDQRSGFVSLSLQGGVVEFRISGPNSHVTVVRSVRMLAIGEWHKIKMAQRGRWLTLWVEGSASSALAPSAEVLVEPESLLYIGGLRDLSQLPHNAISGFPIPFRGCVRGLIVSGNRIVLNETNILESRNIRDCDGTACGGDSCESGGHCWLDEKLQPHCICPEYAKGDRCEFSESCKLVPCKNNGRCLRSGRCSCLNGWGGFYCEIAMNKPTTPNFRGNSYLVLPPPRIPVKDKRKGPSMYIRAKDSLAISLNFSTIEPNGLLLWSGRDNSRFLGLGLQNGHLKLATNLLASNNNSVDAPSGGYLADGGWHNVQVTTDRGKIEMVADGQVIFTEKANQNLSPFRRLKSDQSISYEDIFFLGGFPNGESVAVKTNHRFKTSFKGCLMDVSFGTEPNSIISDFSPYHGENIGSCELHDEQTIV
ncbi:unnamed protein product [Hermetia illucens]|uniref:Protein eyes shut n=1 Tax=Hermetia illucens TaxID=343691 RepID=A0A7R8YRK2_HERIL|nr:unnamed protein product [Hermetia illucens]